MWKAKKNINRRSRRTKKKIFLCVSKFLFLSFLRFKVFFHFFPLDIRLCHSLSRCLFCYISIFFFRIAFSADQQCFELISSHTQFFVRSDWIKIAGKNPFRSGNRLRLSLQPYSVIIPSWSWKSSASSYATDGKIHLVWGVNEIRFRAKKKI